MWIAIVTVRIVTTVVACPVRVVPVWPADVGRTTNPRIVEIVAVGIAVVPGIIRRGEIHGRVMRIVVAETDAVSHSVPIVVSVVIAFTRTSGIIFFFHRLVISPVRISIVVITIFRGSQLRVATREEDCQATNQKEGKEYCSQCFHRAPLDECTTDFLAISMPEGFKKSDDFRKKIGFSWRFERGGKAECIAE